MSIGVLVICAADGTILERTPCYPWPSPGPYPRALSGARIQMFFPHSYHRFYPGRKITPWPITIPKEYPMLTIKRDVPLILVSHPYLCDIILTTYASGTPAILIVGAASSPLAGELINKATTNPEITLPPSMFAAKTWSENEGLWSQLFPLTDEDGLPLFIRTNVTTPCGFTTARLCYLGPSLVEAFSNITQQMSQS